MLKFSIALLLHLRGEAMSTLATVTNVFALKQFDLVQVVIPRVSDPFTIRVARGMVRNGDQVTYTVKGGGKSPIVAVTTITVT
jgi:hypothetical protein